METTDIAKLAGQGGFALVLLGAFVWLVRQVGLAMVAEIKGMRADLSDHTKVDLEHHGRVREAIERLDAKVDTVIDMREREESQSRRAPTEPGLSVLKRRDS